MACDRRRVADWLSSCKAVGYDSVVQEDETGEGSSAALDGSSRGCSRCLAPSLYASRGRCFSVCLLVLAAVLLLGLARWLRSSSPAAYPSWPLCSPSTPAYSAYVQRHAAVVSLLSHNCSAALLSPPRLLVHDCMPGGSCGGFGDRVSKVAGLFLYALLSDRALFLNHSNPRVDTWWTPRADGIDWRVHGAVDACLLRIRQQGRAERETGRTGSVHDGGWSRDFWHDQDWAGWLRAKLLPRGAGAAASLIAEPVVWVHDAHVNTVRTLEIAGVFAADVRAAAELLPLPLHADDTFESLQVGCLLRRLWRASNHTAALIQPLLERVEAQPLPCLVSVHVRWGDELMFHYNRSTLEGKEGEDHRLDASAAIVRTTLECAVRQAHAACATPTSTAQASIAAALSPTPPASALFIFFATDTPRFNDWFTRSVPALRAYDSAQFGAAAFGNISLLTSPWGSPAHTESFLVISDDERERSERQLFSDWSMLVASQAVVTTGSVFSYTAAADGLKYPVDAVTCRPRW